MTPHRIQRKRTKGWRMPPNTVYVGRNASKKHPNPFANPYKIGMTAYLGYAVGKVKLETTEELIEAFRINVVPQLISYFDDLKGKNLACWCRLDRPCHADLLLELGNS